MAVMTDQGASVIARLKERAAREGLQLQLLLNLFCQEEFLWRIQKSRHSDSIVLKGGFLKPVYEAILGNEEFSGTWLKDNRK